MQLRYSTWFVNSTGAVLLVTGVAKVWAGLGNAKALDTPDPILGVSFGRLLLLVGLAEIVLALLCFSSRLGLKLKFGFVAWLATIFLAYRISLWCIGWHHPCGCMGSLADVLHLSDQAADRIMKGVLTYLLVGSYLLLLRGSWKARATPPTPSTAEVASEN